MSEHSKPNQNTRIIQYMRDFGSITQLEALRDLGIMRLASRLSDLRKQGYKIVGEMKAVTNRYGEKCHIKCYKFDD